MNEDQFKYSKQEQVKLNKLIGGLLAYSKRSNPHFPPQWSKNIAQQHGLECNQQTFFKLISNVIDFKLDECVNYVKTNSANNQNLIAPNTTGNKKQSKDLVFRTIAVQSYFSEHNNNPSRPRIYPQFQVNNNQDDMLLPEQDKMSQ